MVSSLRVAVIAGGPSPEAEVSRRSARGVSAALEQRGLLVQTMELDEQLPRALSREAFDVVFPATHGSMGEDGCLQGLLELLGLPYVGSDVRGSAGAAHKPTAKTLFQARGLPVPEGMLVRVRDNPEQAVFEALEVLGDALVVKPASGGSALGVTRLVAATAESLLSAVTSLLPFDDALIERMHVGLEVTCGVLEEVPDVVALPPTLISARAADWYDFRSRYQAGGSDHQCPAPLPRDVFARVQAVAVEAHRAVGARDLSRSDFIVLPDGRVVLLELNTLPGMTPTSNYPEAAAAHGIPFPDLCLRLVEQALARPRREPPRVEPFPG